jgi:hypothetical protein
MKEHSLGENFFCLGQSQNGNLPELFRIFGLPPRLEQYNSSNSQ